MLPKAYSFASSAELNGALTLNNQGDLNAKFVFQFGTTLITERDSSVNMFSNSPRASISVGNWSRSRSNLHDIVAALTTTCRMSIFEITAFLHNGGAFYRWHAACNYPYSSGALPRIPTLRMRIRVAIKVAGRCEVEMAKQPSDVFGRPESAVGQIR